MLQYIINLGQRSRNEPIVVAARRAVGQHMGGGGRLFHIFQDLKQLQGVIIA